MNVLCHRSHKYTKKWYKNGRWHYYYGYGPKKNIVEKIADKMGSDERQNYITAKRHSEADDDMVNYVKNAKKDPKNQSKNVQSFINGELEYYEEGARYSRELANTYFRSYEKTPLYKIEKSIDKGKAFIEKFLKK